ncbi:hypothetical protein L2E82_34141 [Cichorium intybus]|uniref:Uncharacterized protein n=1 Tax=Cichorium intybus TaxID=13427 RepID=A0ACB9BLN5_CICIN|nr:hypothetical protein L2E82_34141 [Cichorium intybus]
MKLMDKMTKEGFIETSNNRRLGKRVIHSEITKKKLDEVRKALDFNAVEDTNENQGGTNKSTLGAFHSIGSELTRSSGKPELQQNMSNRLNGHNNTPTSNNQVLDVSPKSPLYGYLSPGYIITMLDWTHICTTKEWISISHFLEKKKISNKQRVLCPVYSNSRKHEC